jgi:hypothetical protein
MATQRTVACAGCGTILGVPESGIPEGGLACIWCDSVYTGAEDAAAAAAKAATSAATATPVAATLAASVSGSSAKESDKPKAQLHRHADDDDDDGTPYEIPKEAVKHRPCESCTQRIDIDAVICVHCGYDHRSKGKNKRTFKPIDQEYTWGWNLQKRLIAIGVCQGLNVASAILLYEIGGSFGTSLFGTAFSIFLQAFVIGTFATYRIRRNKKGQCEMSLTWRVAFLPQQTKRIEWTENEGVAYGVYNGTDMTEWIVCIVLLIYGIIPGLLWLYFAILKPRHFVALTRNNDYPEKYIYRGLNELLAKEIAQVTTDATALPLVSKLK